MSAARSYAAVLLLALALVLGGCKRRYAIGDQVLVSWEGNVYPAEIIEVVGPTKYKVHYQGYDDIWDEVVSRERIRGFVEGNVVHPEPPAKVRSRGLKASQTNVHKIGDRVRVEWHGHMYPAVITDIVGHERYRVHYEGYGPEWDETVGLSRIQAK